MSLEPRERFSRPTDEATEENRGKESADNLKMR